MGCSPIKAVRELGSERRETVRSLSGVGVGNLRGARNRIELIVRSLAEQNGVTEQLKAENQMEWVRQMNACKAQAEEVVKAELIYD